MKTDVVLIGKALGRRVDRGRSSAEVKKKLKRKGEVR
jgi:hypothetical protein